MQGFPNVAIEERGWFLLITSQKDSYSYKMCVYANKGLPSHCYVAAVLWLLACSAVIIK